MALIGKIRNNMWFVFVLIALATAAFILMDAQGPGGGATVNTPMGVVDGEKVTNIEFDRAYQVLFGNAQDPHSSRAGLWNYFVEQKIIEKEADKLGLHVGYDELMELQFGPNLSPVIYQNFINPQTGQVDFAQLQQIRQTIETGGELNPSFRQFWAEQEKQIKKSQLQAKLTNLSQKAIYTPNWLAETAHQEENTTADIAVVKIPFDNIPAGDITVTDQDIANYIKDRKEEFTLDEENRVVEYVALNVIPTAEDTAIWKEEILETMEAWRTSEDDSLFVLNNNGLYRDYYYRAEEIDEFYQDKLTSFDVSGVYGPYILGNSFQAVKLLDRRLVPDSVSARHILRRVTPGNIAQAESAHKLIDSLMNVAQRGRTPFDTLAAKFSEDLTNNLQGGDLGYFSQGAMVPAFNKATFLNGRKGRYSKVVTSFGVHLVYIDDMVYTDRNPKYKMAYVNVPIIPSKETQDDVYEVMIEYVSSYPYLADLKNAVEAESDLIMERSNDLSINDYTISNLGSGNTSREIVKWAFDGDTELNDVSPSVFTYTDPVNYFNSRYVVAGLAQIKKPGLMKPADTRSQIEFAVLNELKGKSIIDKIDPNDMSGLAAEYDVEVDTLINLNLLNSFIAGLGNEPRVLGAAFSLEIGEVSKPVLGNSGVFVVKLLEKRPAGELTNISFMKQSLSDRIKNNTSLLLMEALKRNVKIKDNRNIFY